MHQVTTSSRRLGRWRWRPRIAGHYDSGSGRSAQPDPIGLAGGFDLYGYANGDPINFGDPFGLCTPFPECLAQALANWGASRGGAVGSVALNAGAALNATFEASGMNLAGQAGAELRQGNVAASAVHLAFAMPGSNSLRGSRAAVRAGLSGLGLSNDVARGVRGVLGSGSGTQWGVRALEGGGVMVHRFVPGSNEVSAAIYTYTLDAAGTVVGSAKQVYDNAGAIANTMKTYR